MTSLSWAKSYPLGQDSLIHQALRNQASEINLSKLKLSELEEPRAETQDTDSDSDLDPDNLTGSGKSAS